MIDTRPQAEDTSLVEHVPTLFERIAIRNLDGEEKATIANTIIEDTSNVGIAYRSQMALSVVIATFGLMIDATAVVIGAMLIAPILRPLEGIAFATTTGNKKVFFQSFALLFLSVLVGVLIAVGITLLIPSFQITNEILARTEPTLIDLGIALASGVIAFLSFGYKKIQASLAGVAMAAALVPPIGVIGIGIGLLQWQIAWGSFLLFITNLVAIIITGVIIFYLFGFFPNQKDDAQRSLINMITALGLLGLLCVPLAGSLIDITKSIQQQKIAETAIQQYLIQESPTTSLDSFILDGDTIQINLISPPDSILTELQKEAITTHLAEQLNMPLEVDVTITPVYTATPLDDLIPSLDERTSLALNTFLTTSYPSVALIHFQISTSKDLLLVDAYTTERFDTIRFREQLHTFLDTQKLRFDTVLVEWLDSPTASTDLDQRTKTIQGVFYETMPDSTIQSLSVFEDKETKHLEIQLWMSSALDQSLLSQSLISYQQELENIFQIPVRLVPHAQYFAKFEIIESESGDLLDQDAPILD